MRTVHDLRLPADRQALGRALAPVIQMFGGDHGTEPLGICWDAIAEVAEDLRDRAIERLRVAPRGSLVARALASLGLREQPTLDALDLARLEGYLDGLVELRAAMLVFVREAHMADTAAVATAARGGRPQPTGEARYRPGTSGA